MEGSGLEQTVGTTVATVRAWARRRLPPRL